MRKQASSDEKELRNIFRLLQQQFGSANRWNQSGFEDQYVSIEKGILLFSYTTGLRGEDLDNSDLEDDIRIDNKKQVEKFLKSKGYDFVLECTNPYCDTFMLTLKGKEWMKKYNPKYAKQAKDECSDKNKTMEYVKCRAEKMEKEQGYPVDKAFATAWSIACKHKKLPDSKEHCQKKPSEYFPKKKKASNGEINMKKLTANDLMSSEDYQEILAEEMTARFEKGKPADPTENMSPEQKEEWEAQKEKNKDNFKKAGKGLSENEMLDLLDELGYSTEDFEDDAKLLREYASNEGYEQKGDKFHKIKGKKADDLMSAEDFEEVLAGHTPESFKKMMKDNPELAKKFKDEEVNKDNYEEKLKGKKAGQSVRESEMDIGTVYVGTFGHQTWHFKPTAAAAKSGKVKGLIMGYGEKKPKTAFIGKKTGYDGVKWEEASDVPAKMKSAASMTPQQKNILKTISELGKKTPLRKAFKLDIEYATSWGISVTIKDAIPKHTVSKLDITYMSEPDFLYYTIIGANEEEEYIEVRKAGALIEAGDMSALANPLLKGLRKFQSRSAAEDIMAGHTPESFKKWCKDNPDACAEWEENTEKYKDVVKDQSKKASPIGKGKMGYVAFWIKGRDGSDRVEIMADSKYEAQQLAVAYFQKTTRKKVKGFDIAIELADTPISTQHLANKEADCGCEGYQVFYVQPEQHEHFDAYEPEYFAPEPEPYSPLDMSMYEQMLGLPRFATQQKIADAEQLIKDNDALLEVLEAQTDMINKLF